jgi:cytoskeleton protein RodZ
VSVGAALARAREERGLSVEDVSAATRIRGGLIRAIEADDYGPCGGLVYARGHIRSIGHFIGIDPEPLVADFDAEHSIDVAAPVVVPAQPTDTDLVARADRRGPNWTAAMVVVLVVICVVAAVGLLRGGNHPGSPSGPTANVSAPPVVSSSSPPAPASPPASAVAQVPTDQAVVLIRVTSDRTWLSVQNFAGRVLFQGLLAGGESRAFRDAKGLRLVIGNAPVVQLVADGREIGAPRSSGNVAHVTVQPGGDVQFA